MKDKIDVLRIITELGKDYYCQTLDELAIFVGRHKDLHFTIKFDKMKEGEYEHMRKATHEHFEVREEEMLSESDIDFYISFANGKKEILGFNIKDLLCLKEYLARTNLTPEELLRGNGAKNE